MRALPTLAALALLLLPLSRGDVRTCVCDPAIPETMTGRECSICRDVEGMPAEPATVFIKDANPNKPNRLLAVPRFHAKGPQQLQDLTPAQRLAYWSAAIAKGRELWGDQWGVALNNLERRTQCHLHVHIGKLLPDAETEHFALVDGPADLPLPADGGGMWIHPVNGKLHVHTEEGNGELKLQR
jgi:CDP-diacylglycerol pyrophosphatase